MQGMALVVAIGVKETGEREVLGVDLGPAGGLSRASWNFGAAFFICFRLFSQ